MTARTLVGAAALAAPGLHILSDLLEGLQGGFSPVQLSATYLALAAMPFLMVGLYAVQRPRIGWPGLLGALLYGAAFVYFAHTALYALIEDVPGYAALVGRLGRPYVLHGGLMVAGGALFGWAVLGAGVLPRWTALLFLAGLALSVVAAASSLDDSWGTVASTLRNAGLMGMGAALLRDHTPG